MPRMTKREIAYWLHGSRITVIDDEQDDEWWYLLFTRGEPIPLEIRTRCKRADVPADKIEWYSKRLFAGILKNGI